MKDYYYQTIVVTPTNEYLVTRFPRLVMIEHSKNGKLILPQNRFVIVRDNDELISDEKFQYICGNLSNLISEKAIKTV